MNTSSAGPGALAVTIDGPSKVKMDCQECPEGYKVTYTPMAPGNYLISIKYGGPYHIVGSPFKAKITGMKKKNFRFNYILFYLGIFVFITTRTCFVFVKCNVLSWYLIGGGQKLLSCVMSNVYFSGSRLVNSHSMHETSSVLVDPVTRNVMTSQQAAPGWGSSDASRVVAKGLGINKGFIGQKNTFSVDCSKAGMNYLEMYYFETKQLAIQSDPVNCKHLTLF